MKHETEIQATPITLYGLARQALAENDGNVSAATAAMAYRLQSDDEARLSISDAIVREAARSYTSKAHTNARAAIIARTIANTPGREKAEAFASAMKVALLDFPLAGGTRLRDATRAEVNENADMHAKLANANAQRARWLRLIGQSIPDNARVGDVLSEDRVTELFHEATK